MKRKTKIDTARKIWLDPETYILNGIKYRIDIHGQAHEVKEAKHD